MKHSPNHYLSYALLFLFSALLNLGVGIFIWERVPWMSLVCFAICFCAGISAYAHSWMYLETRRNRVDNSVTRAARSGAFDSFIEAGKKMARDFPFAGLDKYGVDHEACMVCEQTFRGHKRRVVCWECTERLNKETNEES
jgi:hypothetical protein